MTKVEYQDEDYQEYEEYKDYEDYEDYEDYKDYYYADDYENGFNDTISEETQNPGTDTEDIVELTDRYVAPPATMVETVNNSLQSHSRSSLEDFGIFLELRPPPTEETELQLEEKEEEKEEERKPPLSCPGGDIGGCVGGCVPLAQLWVYSVCVRECARRCP